MTQETMTEAQFARYRGVSKQSVGNWRRKGLLVMVDGRIHVPATNAVLASRPARYRGGHLEETEQVAALTKPDFTDAANWTTAEACRRKEVALALTRELALERCAAKLC